MLSLGFVRFKRPVLLLAWLPPRHIVREESSIREGKDRAMSKESRSTQKESDRNAACSKLDPWHNATPQFTMPLKLRFRECAIGPPGFGALGLELAQDPWAVKLWLELGLWAALRRAVSFRVL